MNIQDYTFEVDCDECHGTGKVPGRPYMDGNSMAYDDEQCLKCYGLCQKEVTFKERYEKFIDDLNKEVDLFSRVMKEDGFSKSEIKESIIKLVTNKLK